MGRATRWLKGLLGGKKDHGDHGNGGAGRDDEKKRQSIGRSWREHGDLKPDWRMSLYMEKEKEQSKHAIAVAAATAAAADAAVAAAQAAMVVVKLTSYGRKKAVLGGGREWWAAVRIQCVFRGYLARKALRALRALVKLQALVRGYLVRKRLKATIHSIQALSKAQSIVRARRSRSLLTRDPTRFHPEVKHRRSMERSHEARSEDSSSFHCRRHSISTDASSSFNGNDDCPRIVEIDPGKPKSTRTHRHSSEEHLQTKSSSLPCHIPARLKIPTCRNFQEFDWCLAGAGERCRVEFFTPQSTPRLHSSDAPLARPTPVTPGKSTWDPLDSPSYMANTQSFKAKVRSQSAPKLRSEPRRRDAMMEIVEPRLSMAGTEARRSYSGKTDMVS